MELHTNSSSPASTLAREPSPILDGRRHGYHWVVIMVAASAFRFRVYDAEDEPIYVDDEDHPHAGKAATAAEKWCEQEHALADAVAWAKAHPCDGSAPDPEVAGEASPTPAVEPEWGEPAEATEHEPAVAAAADACTTATEAHPTVDADEVRELRRQLAEKNRQIDAMVVWAFNGVEHTIAAAADACTTATEAHPTVDADEVRELRRQLAEKNRQIDAMVVWAFNGVEHTIDITEPRGRKGRG